MHRWIAVSIAGLMLGACSAERVTPDAGRDTMGVPGRSAVELDDFGDTIPLSTMARRIVSLNPTTTELIFALGGGDRLVGRTHWDVWPDAARAVPDLGPGVRPNVEAVLAARPDLVILYAGADNRPAAERLRAAGIATVSLKVDRIEHFQRATRLLGRILGDTGRARLVADTVVATLDSVRRVTANLAHPRVVWPVDLSPLIVIGGGSFLTQLIEIAGGVNVYGDLGAVSPQLALEDVHRRDPDIVIANAGMSARIRSDPAWRMLRALRSGAIVEADDVLLGRPSVRMGEAVRALALRLHPELARGR